VPSKAVVTHYIRDNVWKSGGRVPLILNPLRQMEDSGKLQPPATVIVRGKSPGTDQLGIWVGPSRSGRLQISYPAGNRILTLLTLHVRCRPQKRGYKTRLYRAVAITAVMDTVTTE
jgi:hypothetical protein